MYNILISVTDKTNLISLLNAFDEDLRILASKGTYLHLKDKAPEKKIESIEAYTDTKESLNSRVKSLHPKIYNGILFDRSDPAQLSWIKENNIYPIDLVIVNLYPFEKLFEKAKNLHFNEVIEQIDIGGVSLLRAAAKNFPYVSVLSSPEDYDLFISELQKRGSLGISKKLRYELSLKTFQYISNYDYKISEYLKEYQLHYLKNDMK